jgi:hypothetical protein
MLKKKGLKLGLVPRTTMTAIVFKCIPELFSSAFLKKESDSDAVSVLPLLTCNKRLDLYLVS